jgi:hypothetical protein
VNTSVAMAEFWISKKTMKLGENQGFIVSVSSQKMVLAHNFFFGFKSRFCVRVFSKAFH